MPLNTLTDTACRKAIATDKAIKLFDGGGLYLFVSPKGGKAWRLTFRVAGKQQQLSLGAYPALSLADARKQRDQHKSTLASGVDPRAAKRVVVQAKGLTLQQCCDQYWRSRGDVTEGYRTNALRALEMYIYPKLGALPVGSVTRQQVLDALLVLDARGRHVYARRVRVWVGLVFDWAVERGHCDTNPAAAINPEKAFGRVAVTNHAAVGLDEVGALLQRLALEPPLLSVLACKLLALTWVRTAELRMMRWDEVQGDLWLIPAGRMKRRRDHIVPLSSEALALLDRLRSMSVGNSVYVFPNDRRPDRPMSENAVLYMLGRIGYKGRMTGHGWRTVASTWANEQGYNRDHIERQLAHAPDDKVRAAYNRAEYLPQRRVMLQAWADWLTAQGL